MNSDTDKPGTSSRTQRRRNLSEFVQGTANVGELEQMAARVRVVVEARGTFCPEPVIRTQDRMRNLPEGEILLLLADDAGVEVDIPAWCMSTGNEYLGILKSSDIYRVLLRRSESGRQPPTNS